MSSSPQDFNYIIISGALYYFLEIFRVVMNVKVQHNLYYDLTWIINSQIIYNPNTFKIFYFWQHFCLSWLKMSKKVLKRPDLNFGILSHNSLLCNLYKQLWNIINTILITDIFVLCEIKIWTHCSSCQITLQKFLWFTKYSSLLRKQSYTEILIWTKMSSLSIHIPCFLLYLFHLLQEIVLKMATLLKLQTFCWFSVLSCLCADNHTQMLLSIFTRITEYPALERTQKDQVQQL